MYEEIKEMQVVINEEMEEIKEHERPIPVAQK
jgi:hypothetical protein